MIGDGKEILCTKRGNLCIQKGMQTLHLMRVLYAPAFTKNIISLGLLCRNSRQHRAIVTMTATHMSLSTASGRYLNFETDDGILFYFRGVRQELSVDTNKDTSYESNHTQDVVPYESVNVSPVRKTPSKKKHLMNLSKTSSSLVTPLYPSNTIVDTIFPKNVQPTKVPTIEINKAHGWYGHISKHALRTTLGSLGIKPTGALLSRDACAMVKAKATKVSKISHTHAT